MISIVTAIHNQLPYNKLYLHSLRKYSHHPFEVIIIDNCSTDGSAEYFESEGCTVIRNNVNSPYPETQNMGLQHATFDYVCFLNNDVIVGKNWDALLVQAMQKHNLDVVSPAGIERMDTARATQQAQRKWKRTKAFLYWARTFTWHPTALHKLMYGNWEQFCEQHRRRYQGVIIDGFNGNTVFAKKSVFERLGGWDERIGASDWDLYFTLKQRWHEHGDIQPWQTVCEAYVHHFIRVTARGTYPPYTWKQPPLTFDEKWTPEQRERYAVPD